jgi:hypothetical protein
MGEKRNAYRLLVGKPEGKRPLGRPRRRWVDNIRLDIGEVGWGDVDWIGLAKDRNTPHQVYDLLSQRGSTERPSTSHPFTAPPIYLLYCYRL